MGTESARGIEGLSTLDDLVGVRSPDHDTWHLAISGLLAVRAMLDDLVTRTDVAAATRVRSARDELDGCLRAAELVNDAEATASTAGVAVLERMVATTEAGHRVVMSVVEVHGMTKASEAVRSHVTLPG